MTLATLKEQATAFISKSDFKAVFELLSGELKRNTAIYNDLIVLKGRYARNLEGDLGGWIKPEDANREYIQIAKALIHLLSQLSPEDLGQGGIIEDPLTRAAMELPVNIPLTPLFMFNCDRRIPIRSFWRIFNDAAEQNRRFQFYFLPCCPAQQPEGFTERIVYELLDLELEQDGSAMDYRRRPSSDERLAIEPLPLGHNLEGHKKQFKKYFAERFGMANGEMEFDAYLRTGLPKLTWKYVVTAFTLVDEDWDDDTLRPYLLWLLETFSNTGPDIPNFLFFFIVTIKHAHADGQATDAAREAMAGVKALVDARKEKQDATLIDPLTPVPATDLETWLDKLSVDIRQDYKLNLIELLASRLKGDEVQLYAAHKSFNMETIEGFQAKVYHAHKNK